MLSSSAATLNGTVNPQGVPTTYQFVARPATRPSWGVVHPPVPVGTSPVAVNSRIALLTPRTTYYYRLTASKAGRVVSTPVATFRTPG
jgi:hypothetical protein